MNERILIVEDDEDIRTNLGILLEGESYIVELAINGSDALEKLRAGKSKPALIILDLMMPVMDGYQFRLEQERDSQLAQIPVLVITAGGNIDHKRLNINEESYLKKPFDINKVLSAVELFSSRQGH